MNGLFHERSSTIRQISKNRAEQKAFYRFLDNEDVTEEELIKSCCARTAELSRGKHILLLSDTSEVNLNAHRQRLQSGSGIGLVGNNRDIGFFAHLGLAIDLENCQALGFSSIQLWHREENRQDDIDYVPIEKKESYKWIQCGHDAKTTLKEAESITIVSDRESDIYELFCDIPDERTHLIVRNRFNRATSVGERIHNLLENTKAVGNYTIHIAGDYRKNSKKREAILSVKYIEACIEKPIKRTAKGGRPNEVKVWVVEAREEGKSDGICWRLITTHEIKSFADALQIIEWYKMRWWIEEVFRLLKSKGYRIEDSQLENGWAIRKLTVMVLQTILRVMQMLTAYNSNEDEDAKLTFSDGEIKCLEKVCPREEGKTQKLKNNHKKGTLKWATWVIARLGGWSGYESQRPPGPITLKNGLDKFHHLYLGWCIALETYEIDVGTQ